MRSNVTLARPYARAALDLARSNNALGEWSDKIAFAAALAAAAQVDALIGNPNLKVDELKALFLAQGEAADSSFAGFIGTLAANRRLRLLPEIAALFGEFKR